MTQLAIGDTVAMESARAWIPRVSEPTRLGKFGLQIYAVERDPG
jgi:hypothetical protein